MTQRAPSTDATAPRAPVGRPGRRRPLALAAAAGTLAHHGFELATGVGLVFQPELGLPVAAGAWAGQLAGWGLMASRGSKRWDLPLAVMAGVALGGATVHFALWPTRRGPLGLPVLTEAEGLPAAALPAYNAILWSWAAASGLSLLVETPASARKGLAAGAVAFPLLYLSARHHFRWIKVQAAEHPAWWNRAVRPAGVSAAAG